MSNFYPFCFLYFMTDNFQDDNLGSVIQDEFCTLLWVIQANLKICHSPVLNKLFNETYLSQKWYNLIERQKIWLSIFQGETFYLKGRNAFSKKTLFLNKSRKNTPRDKPFFWYTLKQRFISSKCAYSFFSLFCLLQTRLVSSKAIDRSGSYGLHW